MQSLSEFIQQQLDEKLIMYNNGKKYGQVVFLAGGAGSGKGFAIKNFMQGELFKIRDVDEWKKKLMQVADLKDKYEEIQNMDLKNPKDVFKLHKFVKGKGIKDKTLDLLLTDLEQSRLPNILFDITLKEIDDIENIIPKLIEVGYDPKNIHLTWVLANYSIAVERNANRERVVPDDIMLKTHEGAAMTMYNMVKKELPKGLDGKVAVILNNKENTITYSGDDGKPFKGGQYGDKDKIVIKEFSYLTLKKEGKRMEKEEAVMRQLMSWIRDNIPKTSQTKKMW